jgi:hypothetical protein
MRNRKRDLIMDKIDLVEQTEPSPGGIDRRSALKKAAVAGAVAWTAPMVLSSRVSAGDGFCTPKCDPDTAPTVLSGCAYCLDGNSKVPKLTLGVEGVGACGACGGTSVTRFSLNTPFAFQKNGSGNSDFFGTLSGAGGNELIVAQFNNSTLGNGLYTSTSGGLVTTSTCTDRNGDEVVLTCTYGITFFYQPANGACQGAKAPAVVPGCSSDVGVFRDFSSTLQGTCVRKCNAVLQPR